MLKKSYDTPVLEVYEIGVNVLLVDSLETSVNVSGEIPNAYSGGSEEWDNNYDI